ncbi:MAG: hypothetical protein IJQ43_01270 [Oscillospiraceae bacterium]|nr:hypothetical protein [Oscillospiraceae bacterium]
MSEKRKLRRVILAATLVFALTLALILGLAAAAEKGRGARIEAALEKGDTQRAEKLIARLDEGEEKTAYENRCRFLEAESLLESGEYRRAASLFAALGGYEGAEEGGREALYRLAAQELAAGEFDTAQRRFEALGLYRDAAAMARRAQLEKAKALVAEGQIYDAFLLLYRLGEADGALALAEQICGRRDLDAAFAVAQNLSSEELARRAELKERREALPRGIVDVGFFHTVALKSDGTVLACGDDSYGQCRVEKWRGVKAVCAGAYHTVALFADGTVAAVGRSDEGQCDTQEWRDVVAITAADYATFGLRSDGSIVCCGYNDYYMLEDWPKVTMISGGSYALAALRTDGEALITHESARSDELSGLVAVAVNTGYAVGLREDGSVVCAAAELSAWRDIVAVSASSNLILGLDARGSVHAHFFRAGAGADFTAPDDVAAMAAGGTHCVFVRSDGTLAAWGENSRGECGVAGWDLF